MKALVLGLLISCVPVCFASSTPMPQGKEQPQKIMQGQTKIQSPAVESKKQRANKPQAKQVGQAQRTQYAQRAPQRKVITHSQKRHQRPVVIERHYYYENGQPRRVIVRKHIQERPPVRRRVTVYRQQPAPRIVRRYEYREPTRVYVAPAPILSLGIGYTFHR